MEADIDVPSIVTSIAVGTISPEWTDEVQPATKTSGELVQPLGQHVATVRPPAVEIVETSNCCQPLGHIPGEK